MEEPTNPRAFWQPERIYFLKAYALWWLTLAFVGSLLANGPSKTFIGAVWNPLVWNVAGFSALLFATLQTNYRVPIKQFFERRSVVGIMTLLFWGMQANNIFEHWRKHPLDTRFFGVTAFAVFGVLVATGIIVAIVLIISKQIHKQLPSE